MLDSDGVVKGENYPVLQDLFKFVQKQKNSLRLNRKGKTKDPTPPLIGNCKANKGCVLERVLSVIKIILGVMKTKRDLLNRVDQFLKKLWCCFSKGYNKIIWFY